MSLKEATHPILVILLAASPVSVRFDERPVGAVELKYEIKDFM